MLIRPAQILRLLVIQWVLVRHDLVNIVLATHLFRPLRYFYYLWPLNWLRHRYRRSRGERIRSALEDLGPLFVKFGQILSTRRDLLPDDIADELAKLQDAVPPFPGDAAVAVIEQAYGRGLDEVFTDFDRTALASASVAQVHLAHLRDGREMIVKVLRPGIRKRIQRDVALLYTIARLASRYWEDGRRLRPVEVIAEFEKTLLDELDLMREAANASQLRRNFEGSDLIYVPEVDWPLTKRNVMVMERIQGIPISDVDALREAGIDLKYLSEAGVEIFFTQVFRDSFFHADMHPGNIFVFRPEGGRPAMYAAVDFGIMGTLGEADQRYLAENFLAFFNRDYRRVAELHVESGWVPKGTREDEFEAAIRSVCEPIFQRPLSEISFGQLLLRLFQTARRFNMEIQPQLVLLQKTLLNIEGLGRQLYPDLDLWQTAKPFLERWMSEQVGTRAFVNSMKKHFPRWAEHLPELPLLAYDVLQDAKQGKLQVQWQAEQMEDLRREIRRANRRSVLATIGAAALVGAAVILGLDGHTPDIWAGVPSVSWTLGGLGIAFFVAAWAIDGD